MSVSKNNYITTQSLDFSSENLDINQSNTENILQSILSNIFKILYLIKVTKHGDNGKIGFPEYHLNIAFYIFQIQIHTKLTQKHHLRLNRVFYLRNVRKQSAGTLFALLLTFLRLFLKSQLPVN